MESADRVLDHLAGNMVDFSLTSLPTFATTGNDTDAFPSAACRLFHSLVSRQAFFIHGVAMIATESTRAAGGQKITVDLSMPPVGVLHVLHQDADSFSGWLELNEADWLILLGLVDSPLIVQNYPLFLAEGR